MAGSDPVQPLLHGHPLKTPKSINVQPSTPDVDVKALAERIGHVFAHPELAAEALTHRGALERRRDLREAFPHGNERLEFLGDRVLSLAMSEQLLRRFPHEGEGQIARRYSVLVSAKVLNEIAGEIGLSPFLRGGNAAPTPAVLADAVEALLGAIFLDAGFAAAAQIVRQLWGARLENNEIAERPAKSRLQEWAQGKGHALPSYRQVGRTGTEHQPLFTVEVAVGDYPPAQGQGPTKREAESAAARAFFEQLEKS